MGVLVVITDGAAVTQSLGGHPKKTLVAERPKAGLALEPQDAPWVFVVLAVAPVKKERRINGVTQVCATHHGAIIAHVTDEESEKTDLSR